MAEWCRSLRHWGPTVRSVATALFLLVALLAPAAPASSATADAVRIRAISHNIAGGPINKAAPRALRTANEQIRAFGPDVVGLQEVCAQQRDAFRLGHLLWSTQFVSMRSAHPGCGGRPQGQLLASPHRVSDVEVHQLPDDLSPRQFRLLCGTVHAPQATFRACVTHLRAGPDGAEARLRQSRAIAAIVRDWQTRMPVVLLGDLNTKPQTRPMGQLYAIDGGSGPFYEADQSNDGAPRRHGEPTIRTTRFSGKYDYAMFTARHAYGRRALSAGVVRAEHSDHDLLRAWFRLKG